MRETWASHVLSALLLSASLTPFLPLAEAQSFVGDRITARLEPPFTYYDVTVRILEDLGPLDYAWSRTNLCGTWTAFERGATWEHGDTSDCEHLGGGRHDGIITVVVTDASGWTVTCVYPDGSLTGSAACGDPEEPSTVVPPTSPPTTTSRRPPVVKIVEPAAGTIARNQTELRVYWTANDPDGDLESQRMDVRDAGGLEKDAVNLWEEHREAYVPAWAVADPGLYTITVTATDKTGLTGSSTVQVLLTPHTVAIGNITSTTTNGCGLSVGGQMQPAQGAWQDDTQFPDRPGLQLLRLEPAVLEAQTPMVVDRETALFGVRQPRGEPDQGDPMRRLVFLVGEAQGSIAVPTFLKATITTSAGERELWRSPATWMLHLDGPCDRAPHPFLVGLDAAHGAGETFRIQEPGGYDVTLELHRVDTGAPTGLRLSVVGETVETQAPRLLVVPVTLSGTEAGPEGTTLVQGNATRIAADLRSNASDIIPSPTGPWSVRTMPLMDLHLQAFKTELKDNVNDKLGRFLRSLPSLGVNWNSAIEDLVDREVLSAVLADRLATGATLTGTDRTVIVLSNPDFDRMVPPSSGSVTYAFSNPKTVVVRQNASLGVVVHELTHSLPFLWSSGEMVSECGVDYHNQFSMKGAGGRVTRSGVPMPSVLKGVEAYMGGGAGNHAYDEILPQWTEQCTYRHLTEALQAPIDPPVLLVRAFLSPADAAGILLPPYVTDSIVDQVPGGAWAFVVRDAAGGEVLRHAFDPPTTDSQDRPLRFVSAVARLPLVDNMATLELESPQGVASSLDLSGPPPQASLVTPTTPEPVEGPVEVSWSVAPGTLSTLLLSEDAGATWVPVVIETTMDRATIHLAAGAHVLRLLVNDGARSASLDSVIDVKARPPVATPTSVVPTAPATAPPTTPHAGETAGGTVQAGAGTPLPSWILLLAIVAALRWRRR